MSKRKLITVQVLACVSILGFSSCGSTGGSYKIVDTGQAKCFDDRMEIAAPTLGDIFYGQDAQHVGNVSSYTDNGDGTITDNVTGLMWRKGYQVMSMDEALEALKDFSLAGHKDWRLPSIKEAYSLILFSGSDVSVDSTTGGRTTSIPFIDTDYFDFEYAANGNRPIDSQMLSSTLYVGSEPHEELVFGVNFADGRIKGYGMGLGGQDKQFVVRFVRGKEYGTNKFVDNGDGTISDTATELMWSQDDSMEAMNWQDALDYAQEMNSRNYRGYSDWRVPNAKELQSIVDYSRSPLTTSSAAIDPKFNVSTITDEAGAEDYPFYWTSTTHENSSGQIGGAAVYVAFGRSLGNMSNSQNMGGEMPMMARQAQRPTMRSENGQRPEMANGQRPERGNGERPQMADGQRPERGNGERPQMANGQRPERGNGERPQMADGQRPERGNGERPQMANGEHRERGNGPRAQSSEPNWIDIHGAGSQRSDPKSGDPTQYATGHGPQGDAIRIYNYVRLVRDL